MDPHPVEPVDYSVRRGAAWWTGMLLALTGFIALCVWVAWSPAVDLEDFWPSHLWLQVLLVLLVAFVVLLVVVRIVYRSTPRDVAIGDLSPEALRRLRPTEVGRFVRHAFGLRGYQAVSPADTDLADDCALDLELRKDRQTYVVRCKHWKSVRVDADAVRDFHAQIVSSRAAGGFLLSTGRFSHESVRYVRDCNLTLIDGKLLKTLLADEGSVVAAARPATARRVVTRPADWEPVSIPAAPPEAPLPEWTPQPSLAIDPARLVSPPTPACPMCSSPMVLRIAKRGRRAGRGFWACGRGRSCKGIRSLA